MVNYKVFSLSELLELFKHDERSLISQFYKFTCSKEKELETFLASNAIEYEKIQYGKTFIILNSDKLKDKRFEIIAFFTIGQKSLDISKIKPKKKRKMLGKLPGRDDLQSIPGYLIGQIGRSDKYTHDDLPGKIILQECYSRIESARKIVGGNLLLLECHEKMFKLFYKGQEFHKISDQLDHDLLTLYRKL